MDAIKVSHTGLCVSDLETSVRFYTEGLGFETVAVMNVGNEVLAAGEVEADAAELTSHMIVKDGLQLELMGWATPSATGTPSTTRNHRGLTHLSFIVDDLAVTEDRLVALGATVIESTRTHVNREWVVVDMVFLADPDGTRIELIQWNSTVDEGGPAWMS